MQRTLQVLLVDDSRDDAELLERALRREGLDVVLERVDTAEGMSAALERRAWDVVLSDFTMPRFSGLAALELLKKSRAFDVPFIFVSGTLGEDLAVNAMRRGANDYVLKGNLARLAPAIEREVRERESRDARRRAEHELRRSEERYGALFEAAPFPMWVFDRESLAILAVNDAAIRHYGFSREEFAKLTIADMRPPEDVPALRVHLADLPPLDLGSTWRHRKKDGSIILVEVKAHDLDFGGRRARLVAVNDVTERVRAEEALQAKDEQLRQSQKMEAVGRLAGGVAHDFNNMLSVILSYADLMASGFEPADPRLADLGEIRDAGRRAAELTKELLLFSRQQIVERRVIDLNALLAGVGKLLHRVLGEDIELVCRFGESPARVRANPGHVEQVLMNLVVNARDAMPAGGRLTVETTEVSVNDTSSGGALLVAPGLYVLLAVTDTGTGMDRATQARIFDPFFTTKERGKGTGLGLATVFGIVQQSGGFVEVCSEVGKGTTFKVHLPRVDAVVDAPRSTIPPRTVRGNETILVVEDEEHVRGVVCNILRRNGYDVIDARSPEEAVSLSGKVPQIRLLLSDVIMPRMSGPELSRLVLKNIPGVRVLLMSGYTDDDLNRYVLDSNLAVMQKPITPESLTRKVREVLDRRGRAGDAGVPAR